MHLTRLGVLLLVLAGCAGPEAGEEASSEEQLNVTAGACKFEKAPDQEDTRIRIEQVGGQSLWFDFALPTKDVPLEDGYEATIQQGQDGDYDKLEYSGGQLEIVLKRGSNFSTDKVSMTIDSALTKPGKVTYERKVDWWLRPFHDGSSEKFVCESWQPN